MTTAYFVRQIHRDRTVYATAPLSVDWDYDCFDNLADAQNRLAVLERDRLDAATGGCDYIIVRHNVSRSKTAKK